MNTIGTLHNLSNSYLFALQNTNSTGSGSSATGTAAINGQMETTQLSPFAQIMSTLQQLQESNPTEYQQLTQQIAANLQNAAQTATADGNSTQATQLSQLSTDFTSASKSGQLPDVQDLAQAIGGGHHHHHHHFQAASSGASADTDSSATNPLAIIENTLSSAGINVSSNG